MKVLIATDPFASQSNIPLKLLNKYKFIITKASERNIPKNVENFDAVIAGVYKFDKEVLKKFKNLKIISRVGIGYDSIDLDYIRSKNIKLTITPNFHGDTVAELILSLILSKVRKIFQFNQNVKKKLWTRVISKNLKDYQIGIIGIGRVSKSLLRILKPFSLKTIFVNDLIVNKNLKKKYNVKFVNKKKLIKNSNIIILNIPTNSKNKNIMSKKYFNIMKKDVFFINTSRGDLVNEADLYNFLKINKNAFAALDVFNKEPYFGKLLKLKNTILTPHIASHTQKTRDDMEIEAVKNLIDFYNKKKLKNEVV